MATKEKENKRTINYLSMAQRIEVIHEYDRIQNITYIAKKFNCGMKQIRNIVRRRDEYLQGWVQPEAKRLPSRRPSRIRAVNVVLNEWVRRSYAQNCEVDEELMKSQGQKIADRLNISEFRPDKRWTERFQQKYKKSYNMKSPMDGVLSLELDDIIVELQDDINQALVSATSPVPPMMDNTSDSFNNISASDLSFGCIDKTDLIDSGNDSGDNMPVVIHKKRRTDSKLGFEKFVTEEQSQSPRFNEVHPIGSYREALHHIAPLEQFVLMKENIRAIGLLNQIENIFRDEMAKET